MRKIKVQLSEYNPHWEQQYAFEQNEIGKALGDSAIRIEHIGSTSIKGLKAKPIIDILVGVRSLDEVLSFIDALSKIDYEYVPKLQFKDRRFFRKGLWGQGTIHLHICEYNGNEWAEKLLFLDYLRSHPKAANEYAVLKNQLASKYRFDRHTQRKKSRLSK
ncbi:GrpB family protein [Lysinibacillus sp. NPDC096212]|uniref:GrpB family protein n=1 Tax=Lysinibacillus sp. NPDC096212 TaxID=3364135 RepID=UPI0037F2EAF1